MPQQPATLPVVLTLAGSDSGGGAGIQADLKTFHAIGCFGTSAITAITAQNTLGVTGVQGIEPDLVAAQLQAILADFPVRAIKTGMLFSEPIIRAAEPILQRCREKGIPIVIDPVMVAASGARLLEEGAMRALESILPLATLITPNIPEAQALGADLARDLDSMQSVCRHLQKRTGTAVLLKGGHLPPEQPIFDFYCDGQIEKFWQSPRQPGQGTHGTGCTLSAAIAAGLAQGQDMIQAIETSRAYLQKAIEFAPGFGQGPAGPLNHLLSYQDGQWNPALPPTKSSQVTRHHP